MSDRPYKNFVAPRRFREFAKLHKEVSCSPGDGVRRFAFPAAVHRLVAAIHRQGVEHTGATAEEGAFRLRLLVLLCFLPHVVTPNSGSATWIVTLWSNVVSSCRCADRCVAHSPCIAATPTSLCSSSGVLGPRPGPRRLEVTCGVDRLLAPEWSGPLRRATNAARATTNRQCCDGSGR